MGRPKLDIDPIEVEKLAAMGCSNREIAAFFDCDESVIRNRFPAVVAKGQEKGKSKLRRLMWQSAEKGSYVMQIWLSKQLLGMTDKMETKKINALDGMSTEEQIKTLKDAVKFLEDKGTDENKP